jgi:SAM-dependent methyltransferase
MKISTARRLLRLNRGFYDRFAREFAESRSRLSPGVRRAVGLLADRRSLLDVGCGDGRIGRALASGSIPNRVERYLGVDFSRELLAIAAARGDELPAGFEVAHADFSEPAWARHLVRTAGGGTTDPCRGTADSRPAGGDPVVGEEVAVAERFQAAICLAVLFHVPGARRRLRLLRQIRDLLAPGAPAIVSVWQLLHVPRLRARIVPWSALGLRKGDVDAGDLLLDWRSGGRGLRYVHHFEPEELAALCQRAGFTVTDRYLADGATRDMSLFLILRREHG